MKKNSLLEKIVILVLFLAISNSCKKLEWDDLENPYYCSGGDGILCDVAGVAGETGGSGEGKSARIAFLYWPMDIVEDSQGRILIVDFNNHSVRRIETDGTISRIIGSGLLGDNPTGPATSINLNHPAEIKIGPNGDYWLSAWHNWKIKKIDQTSWQVTSPIGTSQGFAGDSGTADTAKLNLPSSLVFDTQGNIFITDQGNQCIRRVDAVSNIITTFAGSTSGYADGIGNTAQFAFPAGSNAGPGGKIALTNDGTHLIMADTENNRIRKIDIATAEVTTIAGTGAVGYSGDGGAATAAALYWPTDIAIGPDGSIYIADAKNNVVRKINGSGIISTVAGTGGEGSSPNGTMATSALLYQPHGIYVSADNTLYIADTRNQQVKKVKNP
ncbi:MAG TPA: hypothetical protein EYN41_04850 [Flavobacteriales bacterium]|nr:hypothetical protein [Flavobacteriales bacterium]